jgi:hypothetical protein
MIAPARAVPAPRGPGCTSSDKQRREKAWRVINRAHAELQARRAAEAAAASHSVMN